jgi:hypothetical protein
VRINPHIKFIMAKLTAFSYILLGLLAGNASAQPTTVYKVLDTTRLMGSGGIDYVSVDNDGRRIYVPRGTNTLVFDLDSPQIHRRHRRHRRPRSGH